MASRSRLQANTVFSGGVVMTFHWKLLRGGKYNTLSIQLSSYVLRKGLTLQSYCGDGIGTIKPTLGKGMDA